MNVVSDFSERGMAEEREWPPGFRFHPTDEELVLYYLKRKICRRKIQLDIICETDVYKWDPEELPGISLLKTGDRQWFFFSPRDRKYPNGARSNRATRRGYWKATGKDRIVTCNSRNVGLKKTLVFYEGRAPSGSRTDWVMHEYTLDEEEFKRCQNVKDYYALYKVYKKSGPGPKNGEQYGAPFKEDDWADVQYHESNNFADREIPVKQLNDVASVADVRESVESSLSIDDIEELMKQIPVEPVLDFLEGHDNPYSMLQILGQETESTVVDPCPRDLVFSKPDEILHSSVQLCGVQGSLNLTNSVISPLHSYEGPGVSSAYAPNFYGEDFLEIDDLLGPESNILVTENPANNLLIENMDGFSEFDIFHDAAMFLHDLGPIDHGTVSELYLNEHKNSLVNQVECQSQSDTDCLNQSSNPIWIGNQPSNIVNLSESHNGYVFQASPGMACESFLPITKTIKNQGNEGSNDDGAVSRFSSSLWAFVESIPTTPASASENKLVNRAFERMSSLKRLRINPRNTQVSMSNDTCHEKRAGKVRGLFFISIIVAMCAIIWVIIGGHGLSRICIFT